MVRRTQMALAVSGLAVLGGKCSTAPARAHCVARPDGGMVTGVASPCWPYAFDDGMARAVVEVTVTRDGEKVAGQAVRGEHVYHFELPAGTYVVSTPYAKATLVTIATGDTTKVDLPDDCA